MACGSCSGQEHQPACPLNRSIPLTTVLHIMGPLVEGEQHCTRCGAVLYSLVGVAYPSGEPPPMGFALGPVSVVTLNDARMLNAGELPGAERCGAPA